MGIKLSEIQKADKELKINLQEKEIIFRYRVNAVTPAFLKASKSAVEQLTEVVTAWNLELEDGVSAPITVETMDSLPVQLQILMLEAINTDIRGPSEDEKKSSSGG